MPTPGPAYLALGFGLTLVLGASPSSANGLGDGTGGSGSRLASQALLLDLASPAGALVAVGERGTILRSSDRHSWESIASGVSVTLNALTFAGDRHGWAVGHDAVILATNDGGTSWIEQYRDPEAESPLLDVWFGDPQHGVAVGAYGLALETFDGGTTWNPRELDTEASHFYGIDAVAESTLVVVGEFGRILRSVDLGESWAPLDSPYDGTLFGVLPLAPQEFLVYGLRGHLFRTHDDGETWEMIHTGTELSIYAGAVDGPRISLVGAGGLWMQSTDGGATFTRRELWRLRSLSAIESPVDRDVAILAGELGVFRYETPLDDPTHP